RKSMLSAEHDLARRDPALPGLDRMLDDDRLADWLADNGMDLVSRNYLRYKPGTSCVAGVTLASGPGLVLTVSAGAAPKLHKSLRAVSDRTPVAVTSDRLMLASAATADRDLPGAGDVTATLRRLLPLHDWTAACTRTLSYKPQRRWVQLLRTPDAAPVVLRLQRPQSAWAAARILRRLDGATPVVPELLGYSRSRGAAAVDYLPGRTLHAGLTSGTAGVRELQRTGEVLARLHGRVITDPGAGHRRGSARASARQVGVLLPWLRTGSERLAEMIESRLPPSELTLCHGDFSADQVVLDETGDVRFIDWDAAGMGDPAADLAGAAAAGLTPDQVAAVHN